MFAWFRFQAKKERVAKMEPPSYAFNHLLRQLRDLHVDLNYFFFLIWIIFFRNLETLKINVVNVSCNSKIPFPSQPSLSSTHRSLVCWYCTICMCIFIWSLSAMLYDYCLGMKLDLRIPWGPTSGMWMWPTWTVLLSKSVLSSLFKRVIACHTLETS